MTAGDLQRAGYFCTPNPWDIKVQYCPAGGFGASAWTEVVKYQDGLSLDERMALGWDQARAHWTMRRLAGEV